MVPPFTDCTAADSKIVVDKISLEFEQAVKASVEANNTKPVVIFKICFDVTTLH
jgi:hypothetical protein